MLLRVDAVASRCCVNNATIWSTRVVVEIK
jgi:hypothetical protein